MWSIYFFCTVVSFGLVRSRHGANIEFLPEGMNNDDMEFIINAQRTYCLNTATCKSLYSSVNTASSASLELRLENQIKIQPVDYCDICTCSSVCCCETEPGDSGNLECLFPQVKSWNMHQDSYPSVREAFLMETHCPSQDFNDTDADLTIIQKCYNNKIDDAEILTAPVFDRENNITYMNKFCAICNKREERNLINWDISIKCTDDSFKPLTLKNTFVEVQENKACNIIYYPVEEHIQESRCTRLIDKCNVTGIWVVYDSVIERACALYTAPYSFTYKNIFCYICNVNKETDIIVALLPKVSLSILLRQDITDLDLSPSSNQPGHCSGKTAYDIIQGTCVRAMCMSPKIFIRGSCVNIAKRIGGAKYNVFLVAIPQFLVRNVADEVEVIGAKVKRWLNKYNLLDILYTFSVHVKKQNVPEKCKNKNDESVQYFVFHMDLLFSNEYELLKDASSLDNLLSIKNFTVPSNSSNVSILKTFAVRFGHFDMNEEQAWNLTLREVTENGNVTLNRIEVEIIQRFPDMEEAVTLKPTSICPLIELYDSFYNISFYNWGILIHRLDVRLYKSEYLATDEENCNDDNCVFVCLDTMAMLKEKYEKTLKSGVAFGHSTVAAMLVAVIVPGEWSLI